MLYVVFVFLVISPFFSCSSGQLYEGDQCEDRFGVGVCTPYRSCAPAVEGVAKNGSHGFLRCGFLKHVELVCCPSTTSRQVQISQSARACDNYTKDISVFVNPQIVRGKDALVGEFPSMAALGMRNPDGSYDFDCGGTLISSTFVLTAGHCVFNIKNAKVEIVRMGVTDVPHHVAEADEGDYRVKRVVRHPEFFRRRLRNDIALVELEKEVVFTENVRPACLDNKGLEVEDYVVAGWGETDQKGTRKKALQKGFVKTHPFETCNLRYAKITWPLNNTLQMCTVESDGDTCQGDSGGPLFSRTSEVPVLVGITSFGGNCESKIPTVYTKVSVYLKWIEDIVWPRSEST